VTAVRTDKLLIGVPADPASAYKRARSGCQGAGDREVYGNTLLGLLRKLGWKFLSAVSSFGVRTAPRDRRPAPQLASGFAYSVLALPELDSQRRFGRNMHHERNGPTSCS